jgi:hypothetical protein
MSTVVDDTKWLQAADCSIDVGGTARSASRRKAGATPRGNPERCLDAGCHAVVDVDVDLRVGLKEVGELSLKLDGVNLGRLA